MQLLINRMSFRPRLDILICGIVSQIQPRLLKYVSVISQLLATSNENYGSLLEIGKQHGLFGDPDAREAIELAYGFQLDTVDGRSVRRKLELLKNFFASTEVPND